MVRALFPTARAVRLETELDERNDRNNDHARLQRLVADARRGTRLVRVRDAAAIAGLSLKAAYRRIERGSFPGVRRVGRSIRIDLHEFLRSIGAPDGAGR